MESPLTGYSVTGFIYGDKMNYFDDLLESYTKLKSRKLILSEGIDATSDEKLMDAVGQARAAIQDVLISGATQDMPTQVPTPFKGVVMAWPVSQDMIKVLDNGSFGFYPPQVGIAKISTLDLDQVNLMNLGTNSNPYKFLLGFAQDREDADQDGIPDKKETGNMVQLPDDAKILLSDTAELIPRLQSRAFNSEAPPPWSKSSNKAKTYLVGEARQSFERKIASTTSLMWKQGLDGASILVETQVPDSLLIESCRSVKRLISLAVEGPKTEEDAKEFKSLVAKAEGNQMIIYNSKDKSEGVVIKNNAALDFAYDEIIRKTKKKFPKITLKEFVPEMQTVRGEMSTNELNNFRGKVMEEFSVVSNLLGMIGTKPEFKETLKVKAMKVLQGIVQNDVPKLEQAYNWVSMFDSEIKTPDLQTFMEMELYRNIQEHYGPNASEALIGIIKKQVSVDKGSIRRGADFVIPVGKQVGLEKSADITEGFVGPDAVSKAKSALLSVGVAPEDVGSYLTITTPQEIAMTNPKFSEVYGDMYGPADQAVTYNISLKNYLSLKSAKLSETTFQSLDDSIKGGTKVTGLKTVSHKLGIDYVGGSNYYEKKLSKSRKAVEKLFKNSIIVNDKTGKEIDGESIRRSSARSISDQLRKHLDYAELKSSDVLKILDKDSDFNNPYQLSKVAETLSRRLTVATLKRDLKKNNKQARSALALMFRALGGVNKPTLMDIRDLSKSKSMMVGQNKVVDEMIGKLMKGQLNIKFHDYTIRIEDPEKPTNYMSLGMQRKDREEETGKSARAILVTSVSKALLADKDKEAKLSAVM